MEMLQIPKKVEKFIKSVEVIPDLNGTIIKLFEEELQEFL